MSSQVSQPRRRTNWKKKSSQALQQAILTLIFTVPILSLGGDYSRFFRMGLIRLYIYPNVSVWIFVFCGGGPRAALFFF